MEKQRLTWDEVGELVGRLLGRLRPGVMRIYGLKPHGAIVARELVHAASGAGRGLKQLTEAPEAPAEDLVVLDAAEGTGRTLGGWRQEQYATDSLTRSLPAGRSAAPKAPQYKGWVVFPWEPDFPAYGAYMSLLREAGCDVARPEVRRTAQRAGPVLLRRLQGEAIVDADNPLRSMEMGATGPRPVVQRGILFAALHDFDLSPFIGNCGVGYCGPKTVNPSEIAALVQLHARKLTNPRKLAHMVLESVAAKLSAKSVIVVVEATIWTLSDELTPPSPQLVSTVASSGTFESDAEARREFLGCS